MDSTANGYRYRHEQSCRVHPWKSGKKIRYEGLDEPFPDLDIYRKNKFTLNTMGKLWTLRSIAPCQDVARVKYCMGPLFIRETMGKERPTYLFFY